MAKLNSYAIFLPFLKYPGLLKDKPVISTILSGPILGSSWNFGCSIVGSSTTILSSCFFCSFLASLFVSNLLIIPMLLMEFMLEFVGCFFYYGFGFCSTFGSDFYFDFSSTFGRLPDPSTLFKIWFRGLLGCTIGGILGETC